MNRITVYELMNSILTESQNTRVLKILEINQCWEKLEEDYYDADFSLVAFEKVEMEFGNFISISKKEIHIDKPEEFSRILRRRLRFNNEASHEVILKKWLEVRKGS